MTLADGCGGMARPSATVASYSARDISRLRSIRRGHRVLVGFNAAWTLVSSAAKPAAAREPRAAAPHACGLRGQAITAVTAGAASALAGGN